MIIPLCHHLLMCRRFTIILHSLHHLCCKDNCLFIKFNRSFMTSNMIGHTAKIPDIGYLCIIHSSCIPLLQICKNIICKRLLQLSYIFTHAARPHSIVGCSLLKYLFLRKWNKFIFLHHRWCSGISYFYSAKAFPVKLLSFSFIPLCFLLFSHIALFLCCSFSAATVC